MPRASGSYHVERAILPSGEYDWVVHSAPIDSLVTLMSLRVAEILYDRMYSILYSLVWIAFRLHDRTPQNIITLLVFTCLCD